jgi:hypothetical protein
MVKKTSSIRLLTLALCLAVSAAISQSAFAQTTISVQAVPFHRFITQNQSLGNFLTANFSEGSCCPYNYAYTPFPSQADIVPLVPGYVPRSDQGLTPVYAWQVIESPRIYYYYSIFYASHASNYHYQGVVGYAMASNDPRGTPLYYWYSQYYGFYYTVGGETPPWGTFQFQGTSWRLPLGGTYVFDKIPDPVDPCEGLELDRQECINNGNRWNPDTCSCQSFCRFGDCELQY